MIQALPKRSWNSYSSSQEDEDESQPIATQPPPPSVTSVSETKAKETNNTTQIPEDRKKYNPKNNNQNIKRPRYTLQTLANALENAELQCRYKLKAFRCEDPSYFQAFKTIKFVKEVKPGLHILGFYKASDCLEFVKARINDPPKFQIGPYYPKPHSEMEGEKKPYERDQRQKNRPKDQQVVQKITQTQKIAPSLDIFYKYVNLQGSRITLKTDNLEVHEVMKGLIIKKVFKQFFLLTVVCKSAAIEVAVGLCSEIQVQFGYKMKTWPQLPPKQAQVEFLLHESEGQANIGASYVTLKNKGAYKGVKLVGKPLADDQYLQNISSVSKFVISDNFDPRAYAVKFKGLFQKVFTYWHSWTLKGLLHQKTQLAQLSQILNKTVPEVTVALSQQLEGQVPISVLQIKLSPQSSSVKIEVDVTKAQAHLSRR